MNITTRYGPLRHCKIDRYSQECIDRSWDDPKVHQPDFLVYGYDFGHCFDLDTVLLDCLILVFPSE